MKRSPAPFALPAETIEWLRRESEARKKAGVRFPRFMGDLADAFLREGLRRHGITEEEGSSR